AEGMAADFDFAGEKDRETSSGAAGRFLVEGLVEGSYELTVRVGGVRGASEIEQMGKEPRDLGDLTIADVLPIAGAVLGPKGEPVEGAIVRAGRSGRPQGRSGPPTPEVRSGPGGRFAFEALEAGAYRVSAWAPDLAETAAD